MPRSTPMLSAFSLACLAATASAAGLGQASGSYACSYKDFKTRSEGKAQVTLVEGKLQAVSFSNSFPPVKGKPVGCTLESARSGQQTWADEGRKTSITFFDPKYKHLEDVFAVSVEDERLVLDFTDTQPTTRCTDGGDLPDRIMIDPRTDRCRVEF